MNRYISAADREILKVSCPRCGAKAGDLCKTKLSRVLYSIGDYHLARRDAWAASLVTTA